MAVALLGVLAALLVGAIVFFTVGERTGIATFAGLAAVAFLLAALAPPPALVVIVLAEVAVAAWAGWQIAEEARAVVAALATTEGPVAAADSRFLASAQGQIEAANAETSFRLVLHEDEMTAVLQDGLAASDQPLRNIEVDIVDGPTPNQGFLDFSGEFKSGDYSVEGRTRASIVAGAVRVEIMSVQLGSLRLPGIARGAVEDYIDRLLDSVEEINALLEDAEVDVQSITIGNDRIVVTGVQRGGSPVTSTSLLEDLAARAAAVGPSVEPPPEVLGPGVVGTDFAEGAVYYLALGDSLAANVGVDDPRQGYVSRVHNQLQSRDGRQYGLLNLGISGETSGSLIRGGQLDEAVEFLAANRVAYVTMNIGANDLLGHLTSPDCAEDLEAVACRDRLESSLAAYEANITEVLQALRRAAPEATIVFLRTYNPFSLGTGAGFETQSGFTLDRLNDLAAAAAGRHGILVADGFTPMEGTTAVTTHMLDAPPDIHPNGLGYDVLAQAVLQALA